MSPKYSFVLPAYKATYLHEAIDSILNQTYKDFELIVVNDASPEDLTTIVNSYHDERIQYYINEKNIGGTDLVAQWNHCITYATGEYLILASDDDVYHPNYLERMDVLVNKYPEVNIFRPRVQLVNSCGDVIERLECLEGKGEIIPQPIFANLIYNRQLINGIPFYIFKRQSLKDLGGFIDFPLAWFSDDATAIQMAKNGIAILDEVLFFFRQSDLSISCSLNSPSALYGKLQATESFYRWFETLLDSMNVMDAEDLPLSEDLQNSKLNHMVWLITMSDRKAVLSSWRIIRKIRTLSLHDCIIICKEVFMRKLFNKLSKKSS